MAKRVTVGLVGVGDISGIYLKNIHELFNAQIRLKGICDLVPEKAARAKEKYPELVIYPDMYALFDDPEIELVLNLTRPSEHYGVSMEALSRGKHVYSEKPLADTLERGKALFEMARAKGLRLGGAPDTCLGAGLQSVRDYVDSGLIGDVIGGAAFMLCHGHEHWHPDPAFYYQHGGGPMMDMGPYYITALVSLLGGVRRVTGVTRSAFAERVITSQPLRGTRVAVQTPTTVMGIMQFASGAAATIHTSFDVYYPHQARLELYGTRGTLLLPDPNGFGGPIRALLPEDGEPRELPLTHDYHENSRALGLCDMASSLLTDRPARLDAQQTLHVLEIMTSFERSAETGQTVALTTRYERPASLPRGGIHGIIL